MEWKSPGQRHHANMRKAAGAEEGGQTETSLGKREDAPGKMRHLNLGKTIQLSSHSQLFHFHHTIRKEGTKAFTENAA